MSIETHDACATCRFFKEIAGGEGLCRKFAPKPMLWHSPQGDGYGYQPTALWPFTDETDWCGEWEATK